MLTRRNLAVCCAMAFTVLLVVILCINHFSNSETTPSSSITSVHYLIAREVEWDYLPEKTALWEKRQEYAEKHLIQQDNPPRFGHIYKKAVFRECVDEKCTEQKPRQPWLGILGPLLKAKVGDVLEIHLLNNLSRPVSLHTHGAYYEKEHEGAFYQDNKSDKRGDKVAPGQSYTYYWRIPENRGPTASDPSCMLWAYHSHVFGDTDIHTGLIGPLIICKPGISSHAYDNVTLSNSYKEYVLLFLIFDENQSWFLDDNLSVIGNQTAEESEELKEEESFQESNLMYSINGLMYDNLPALESCLGSEVVWYVMGMGNEADIHAVTFEGHSLTINDHRTDVIHLFPAKFVTANMKPIYEGRWPIKSQVGDNFLAGMESSFVVKNCSHAQIENLTEMSERAEENQGKIRSYYIAAEEVMWNYAPSGMNNLNDEPLINDSDAAAFFKREPGRIGGTYKKVLYKEYTNDTFNQQKPNPPSLGILGPTLRAEVGDILEVTFFNRASRPYSFHSTAFVCMDCNAEGGKNETVAVYPGSKFTYRFLVTSHLGPADADSQCIAWRYFSNVDSVKDVYSGLNGFLLICRPGSLTDNGFQKSVDKEYALMFAVMDENKSHYIDDNIALFAGNSTVNSDDPDFVESNLMHSINGLMYGNLEGLDICQGDKVSWLLMAIGEQVDMHVAHFWGNTILHQGNSRDTMELLPYSHFAVTMDATNEGTWLLRCQTNDHLVGGMQAQYSVKSCDQKKRFPLAFNGNERTYFIAIVEDEWDYAPNDLHAVTGEKLTENTESKLFVTNDDTHIGSRYVKALFKEYTDDSFHIQKPRRPEHAHLGVLGPFIKAEVGDLIRVILLNNASNTYNIHAHGLVTVTNGTEDPVKPGETKTYEWLAVQNSGPSSTGFNCKNWMYYSSVDSVKDTNSGLVGPLVVCNPGVLNHEGARNDVDREFGVLFTVMDENESWYLERNIKNYCNKPDDVDPEEEDFKESNLKHCMNGRLYGTLEGLTGNVGDKVAWYLMGLGNEIDVHTAHFHGLTAIEKDDAQQKEGHREDVIDLSPGIFRTVEMTFDLKGVWMFHCHVDDHLKAGMMALVRVST